MVLRYLWSVLRHKWYVLVAGRRLGDIPLWRLIIHDWSKFMPAEFMHYARKFQGTVTPTVNQAFTIAWLHHENFNPHHPGYWIPRSGRFANIRLEMPETYVREMVADWMGASKTYTGSWDMSDWLNKALHHHMEIMHFKSRRYVEQVLYELYYTDQNDNFLRWRKFA